MAAESVTAIQCGSVDFYGLVEPLNEVRVADQRGEYLHTGDQVVVAYHPAKELLRVTSKQNGTTQNQVHRGVSAFSFGPEPAYLSGSYSSTYN